jgi:hypothetical protein
LKNEKAKTYVAGFFNGDLKLFDGKEGANTELFSASKLHQDRITDALYFKSDKTGGRKLVVTCSEQPYPQFKVSQVDPQSKQIEVVAEASEDLSEKLRGWNALALNPVVDNLVASASRDYVRPSVGEGEEAEECGSI